MYHQVPQGYYAMSMTNGTYMLGTPNLGSYTQQPNQYFFGV